MTTFPFPPEPPLGSVARQAASSARRNSGLAPSKGVTSAHWARSCLVAPPWGPPMAQGHFLRGEGLPFDGDTRTGMGRGPAAVR